MDTVDTGYIHGGYWIQLIRWILDTLDMVDAGKIFYLDAGYSRYGGYWI